MLQSTSGMDHIIADLIYYASFGDATAVQCVGEGVGGGAGDIK